MIYQIVVLLGLMALASGTDENFPGKCPWNQVKPVSGFVQEKFNGQWYEIQRYEKTDNMDCVEQTYKWEPFDAFAGKYNIRHKEQNLEKRVLIDEPKEISQTFRQPGKYFIPVLAWPVWVVDTDYNTYAVLWTCWDEFDDNRNTHPERITVLARDRNFKINSSPTLETALRNLPNYDASKMKTIAQDGRCHAEGRNTNEDNSAVATIPTILSTILMIIVCKLL